MPRSPEEILAHARATEDTHILITPEEASAWVESHIRRRREGGLKVPDSKVVMDKLRSGSAHVLGKKVRVE